VIFHEETPMADSPLIQIDDDWKRQAQEEKRKLAEQAKAREQALLDAKSQAQESARESASPTKMPPASFDTVIQTLLGQALQYLGDYGDDDGRSMVSLEAARHYIDTLGVLEGKTKGNLSTEEQASLNIALYEGRSRFASVGMRMVF